MPKARSRKPEAESQKPKARSQMPKARSQMPKARSQMPKARSQKPKARSQKPEAKASQKIKCKKKSPKNTPPMTIHATFMQPWHCYPRQRKSQSSFMTSKLRASFFIFRCSLTLLLVMWCSTHTHHHSLSIVSHISWLCDVSSHTTIHWV